LKKDTIYKQTWAKFISKFITEYEKNGIPIWGITIQNEPEFAAPWEACTYTPTEQMIFLRDFLGPTLSTDHPQVQIMIYDHNKDNIVEWAQTIFNDPLANQYGSGVAFHWYSGSQFENLETVHSQFPNKFLLGTEATEGPGIIFGSWSRGEHYGSDIIGDLNNWAVGWVDWNLILDMQGGPNHLQNWCDAPIIADSLKSNVYYQISYYYMGQITRFAIPGSIRINSKFEGEVDINNLFTVSFLTPENKKVVIIMNQSDNNIEIQLIDNSIPNIPQFTQVPILSHSIQTLIY